MERMGLVGGEMVHMAGDDKETHLAFNISSQNMLGVRGSEEPRVGVQLRYRTTKECDLVRR